MKIERVKFYADTDKEKNKFYCWKINSILDLEDTLINFMSKGWLIRSAWYEKFDNETGEVLENTRISDLQRIFDLSIERERKAKKVR